MFVSLSAHVSYSICLDDSSMLKLLFKPISHSTHHKMSPLIVKASVLRKMLLCFEHIHNKQASGVYINCFSLVLSDFYLLNSPNCSWNPFACTFKLALPLNCELISLIKFVIMFPLFLFSYRLRSFYPILLYWKVPSQNSKRRWSLCIFNLVKREMNGGLLNIDWGNQFLHRYVSLSIIKLLLINVIL